MSHGDEKTRKEKADHPERFCRRGTCLVRVIGPKGEAWRCAKHGPRQPMTTADAGALSWPRAGS